MQPTLYRSKGNLVNSTMEELVTNLHIHSSHSDGTGSHKSIAQAGLNANLDVLILTDHNVLVSGVEGYHKKGKQLLLVLSGEEIHDKSRSPEKNHLLVFGHSRELCNFSENPQILINQAQRENGLSFLAHPFEDSLDIVAEKAYSWVDWNVSGFNGIEIWNHLSELKTRSKNWVQLLCYIFFPNLYSSGPNPLTLEKWDELITKNVKVVAIGGSDAHCLHMKKWIFRKKIFPYFFHFKCINTHILVPELLNGDLSNDRQMVLNAFRRGHVFIGYDLPAPTKGFRFYAQGKNETALMGDEIVLNKSITFQIRLPEPGECHLLHDGKLIKTWILQDLCTYIANDPGAYRVEVFINYLGKKRGWIYSNPIYVVSKSIR